MTSRAPYKAVVAALAGAGILSLGGCASRYAPHNSVAAQPLGSLSDPIWQNQEANAERSDFVIHEHEFATDTEFMNTLGEDHLKQIAFRLTTGYSGLILVERSKNSARPDTEYHYPVHTNSDLDVRRREMVVRCLLAMRIPNADALVVISPDLAPEYRAGETAASFFEPGYGGYGGGHGGGFGGGSGGGFSGGSPEGGANVADSGRGSVERR